MQLNSYGDYHVCPNHDDEVMSAAHGETCRKCGWPERSRDTDTEREEAEGVIEDYNRL